MTSVSPRPCPTWCDGEHPAAYLFHERLIEEFALDGYMVEVEAAQPTYGDGPAVVRIHRHEGAEGQTRVVDLAPDAAATLGHVVTLAAPAGPAHRLGVALTRAAGLLLTEGGR